MLRAVLYGSVVAGIADLVLVPPLILLPGFDVVMPVLYPTLLIFSLLGFFGAILARAGLTLVEHHAAPGELACAGGLVIAAVVGLHVLLDRAGLTGPPESIANVATWGLAGWGGVTALCGCAWGVWARAWRGEARPLHRALLQVQGCALVLFLLVFVPPVVLGELVSLSSTSSTQAQIAWLLGLALLFGLGIRGFVLDARCRRAARG